MTQPDPNALSGVPDQSAPSGTPGGEGTSTTETGAPSGADTTPTTQPETVSKADFDRIVNQLRAADQKRSKAEADLQQLRDKDIPEMDKLRRDAEAVKQENGRLQAQLKNQALELAFLRDNTIKWRNPGAALKLADMTDVVINDDGTVTGLKNAMEKLAKSDPYLVDEGKPAETEGAAASPAGVPPMNGKSGTNKVDTSNLVQRMPALGSRRRPSSPTR